MWMFTEEAVAMGQTVSQAFRRDLLPALASCKIAEIKRAEAKNVGESVHSQPVSCSYKACIILYPTYAVTFAIEASHTIANWLKVIG